MKKIINFLKEVKIFVLIGLFILGLLTFSLFNSLKRDYEVHYNFALFQAKENFEKDLIYKHWATLEGGVYVPITEFTPPNPYLDVPHRDVETKEGIKLTLVNPTYMTRMVHGLQSKKDGTISHITSLNPINPENKPDKWEEQALKENEKGIITEKHELAKLNGKDYFRYISPLKVEEACLKCHDKQGYKVGDIRGGISVSIPFEKLNQTLSSNRINILLSHILAAFITLIFLFLAAKTYRDKNRKILEEFNQLNFVIDSANIGYWEYDLIKKELKVNENWLKALGYDPQQFDKPYKYNLTTVHEDDREKTIQVLEDIQNNRLKEFSIEHRVKKENGEFLWVSTRGYVQEFKHNNPSKIVGVQIDIDKDKKIVESIIKQQVVFKSFIENSPLALSITNLSDDKYILVNKAWEKLSGYSQSEAIGKTSLELKFWLDIKERQKFVDELRSIGSVNDLELKFRIKNGKIIPTLTSASIIDIEGSKYIITSIKDITEQKKFEKVLKKEKEMYSYFNFLHSSIDKMKEQDFYNLSIEYLVKLTDSKVGFFHRVSEDQNEIILTTWNTTAKEFCKVEFQTHYPINQAGNWIDCLKTKKAVIYNDYQNSPNQKGLPVGHVPVEKFMSIATYVNEKPYLIFGVGNKEEDYDEIDAQLFESFATELSRLIEKKQYITKIEENERFVSTLINNLPGFVYRCANDKDWTMYYLSKQCKETTGYEPEELLNNSLLSYNDIILPEFQKDIWKKIQDSIKNDLPYELEYQIVKKDGNIIWVWERGRAVKDKDGNILFLEGFITDVNAKKSLEIELVKSEEKFRLIAENIGEVISVFNLNLEYTYISPSIEKLLGYTPEEIIQSGLEKLLDNEFVEQFKKLLEIEIEKEKNPTIDKKRTVNVIFKQKRKDGQPLWIEGTASFLRNKEQQPIGILIVTKDITEKKKLEDLLTENEKKYRLLIEEMNQGLAVHEAIYDENGNMVDYRFLDMNKSFEKILGIKKEDWIGKTVLEILPKTEKYWIDTFEQVVKTGKAFEYENYSVEFDRYYHVVAYNNQPNQFAVIVTDITERKKIQKQLQESETKFKNMFLHHNSIMLLIEPESGNILLANHAASKFYGYSVNELCSMNIKDINILSDEKIYQARQNAVKEYENYFIFPHRLANGNIKMVEVHSSPIDFEGERVLFSIIHDITERKIIEEERTLLSKIIENSLNEIYLFNAETLKFEFANQGAINNLGYSIDELKNMTPLDIKPEYNLDFFHSLLQKLNDDNQMIVFETIHKRKDGTTYPVEVHLQKSIYSNKKFYFTIINDITDRKKAEEEKTKLLTAIEQSRVGVVITDVNGNIEYVNKFLLEHTGYSKEELLGQNPRIFSAGKHSKEFYKKLWTTLIIGNTWEGILYNKKKNGQLYWEYVVISPIKDDKNKIINFVAVKEDITDKINKEQQLNEYKEKLELLVEQRTAEIQKANFELVQQIEKEKELEALLQEALLKEKEINELKTRFFASVSHEFRTPLTAVLTSAQMIQRYGKKWSEEKLETHYQNIDKMINHLTKLLDDIMLISRAEREILKNNPKQEDINLLFNQIIEEHYPSLQKYRKINFHNQCSQKTYNLDSKLMKHIVGNLLSNSIKYGYENTDIDLTVSEGKDHLIIQVEDKGIGIDEIDIKNIFEPFYRTQNSAGIKGTGLGLNIVKRCVDLLGGTIEVESKLNEGTKFSVRIPLK